MVPSVGDSETWTTIQKTKPCSLDQPVVDLGVLPVSTKRPDIMSIVTM